MVDVDAFGLVTDRDCGDGCRRGGDGRCDRAALVAVIFRAALFRRAAKLIERAVGAPGFGIEAARAGDRQDVSMAAAFGSVFGRASPPARFEPRDGGRERRRFDRLDARRGGK